MKSNAYITFLLIMAITPKAWSQFSYTKVLFNGPSDLQEQGRPVVLGRFTLQHITGNDSAVVFANASVPDPETGNLLSSATDDWLFEASASGQRILAKEGSTLGASTEGMAYYGPVRATLADSGDLLLSAGIGGSGIPENSRGILSLRQGAADIAASSGLNDFREISLLNMAVNRTGEVAFWGRDSDEPGMNGIWKAGADTLTVVVHRGQAVPNEGEGITFQHFQGRGFGPALNDAGTVAFYTAYAGTSPDFVLRGGLWLHTADSSLTLIAKDGDQAAGLPDGVRYANLGFGSQPALNNAGQVAFAGGLTGEGVTAQNNEAIWVGKPGELKLLARKGDAAPDMGPLLFSDFYMQGETWLTPALNKQGEVVFSAKAGRSGGIWAGTPGNLRKIVAQDHPAPGLADFAFGRMPTATPHINASGLIVFYAPLYGPGYSSNGNSLWIAKPDGTLSMVARPSSDLPGNLLGSDIVACSIAPQGSGGEQGWQAYMNDNDTVAFLAQVNHPEIWQHIVLARPGETGNAPTISLRRDQEAWQLVWSGEGYQLESTPSLTTPWTKTENQEPAQNLSLNEPSRFFRLMKVE